MVASSVTRRPFAKWLSTPTFFSISLMAGPPPWTSTTRTPSSVRVTRSFMTAFFRVSLIMALPPYLMTMVLPWYFWM